MTTAPTATRKTAPVGAMESTLRRRGFTSPEREKHDESCERGNTDPSRPVRFTYEKGNVRVVTENSERPWWTVQFCHDGIVQWFVDFPEQAGLESIFVFIAANR